MNLKNLSNTSQRMHVYSVTENTLKTKIMKMRMLWVSEQNEEENKCESKNWEGGGDS